jgi:hypothetical protein
MVYRVCYGGVYKRLIGRQLKPDCNAMFQDSRFILSHNPGEDNVIWGMIEASPGNYVWASNLPAVGWVPVLGTALAATRVSRYDRKEYVVKARKDIMVMHHYVDESRVNAAGLRRAGMRMP